MNLTDLRIVVKDLLMKRVYCCEADLQFSLAWKLKEKDNDVRLEIPFHGIEDEEGRRSTWMFSFYHRRKKRSEWS